MMRKALALALMLATLPAHAETIDGSAIIIIDGDTVALPCTSEIKPGCAERVRILNIDAPETRGAVCEAERMAGLEAKARLAALTANGVGTCGADDNQGQAGHLIAPTLTASFASKQGLDNQHIDQGGGYSSPHLAMCLNAGGMGRQDAESETLIVANGGGFDDGPTHTLRAGGFDASEDGTGRGTPLVPVYAIQERAVSENPAAEPDGASFREGVAYTLEARQQVQAVAFPANMSGTQCASTGDLSPALGARNPTAVAFALRGREGGAQVEIQGEQTGALRAANGGSSRDYAATASAVRRLTPRECERLQGFPDDYTAIPWRGKSAETCPDGPRYKALGNSMAVPVMRWIGERIQQQIGQGRTAPKGGA